MHYSDITGEIDVFEALAARDEQAKTAGVMLLPGAGFDVVPSDCLAAHVAARMPDATRLRLSIGGLTVVSQGTAKTMVEGIARGTRFRRGGRIVEDKDTPRATADFGAGPRRTVGVSWGDVSTAWRSTRIPDIEVFFEASRDLDRVARMPGLLKRILATGFRRNGSSRTRSISACHLDRPPSSGPVVAPSSSPKPGTRPANAWRAGCRLRKPIG